ncbi:hypothetical protein [Pantoea ananatis]|uniref:hypothetical protein n=1 Tax=Pantoea ananas TaxID=553 RepID=UPI000B7E5266|nr:hypothetical protein [Pantoea ananatis]
MASESLTLTSNQRLFWQIVADLDDWKKRGNPAQWVRPGFYLALVGLVLLPAEFVAVVKASSATSENLVGVVMIALGTWSVAYAWVIDRVFQSWSERVYRQFERYKPVSAEAWLELKEDVTLNHRLTLRAAVRWAEKERVCLSASNDQSDPTGTPRALFMQSSHRWPAALA